jgi:hypothetical protein
MLLQFVSFLLFNVAQLRDTSSGEERQTYQQLIAENRG